MVLAPQQWIVLLRRLAAIQPHPNRVIFYVPGSATMPCFAISAAIQSKCLSMNHLHSKMGCFQSRSIKANQA
jgi:hypothetical protein